MKNSDEYIREVLERNQMDGFSYFAGYIQQSDFLNNLWRVAVNYKSFVDSLLDTDFDELDNDARELYSHFSKLTDNHWYRIRRYFGDKCFKTVSDVGSLLINNNTLISNEIGDGITRVAIFDNYQGTAFCNTMMHPTHITFNGKIEIYDYDIIGVGKPIKTIEGYYNVFVWEGLIAFAGCNQKK